MPAVRAILRACSTRDCLAAIFLARTPTGGWMPCDEQAIDPAPGTIAYNPQTGGARVVTEHDMPNVAGWQERGISFHRSHWETCVNAAEHRVNPHQEALF